jgi:hypothetical protein
MEALREKMENTEEDAVMLKDEQLIVPWMDVLDVWSVDW